MKLTRYLTILTCILVFLASCSTTKNASKEVYSVSSPAKYAKEVMQNQWPSKALTAKIKFNVTKGDKSYNFRGNLKMKKDEVIQLSLSFIGIEIARLEFTPSEVLAIDRFHHKYIRKKYKEMNFLDETGISFNTLQALFWHELFVPGERNVLKATKRFTTSQSGEYTLLLLKDTEALNFSFLTITDKALLERSLIKTKGNKSPKKLTWRYTNFNKKEQFPELMQITIDGDATILKASIELSNLDNNKDWASHTIVSSRYKKMDINDLFKLLD